MPRVLYVPNHGDYSTEAAASSWVGVVWVTVGIYYNQLGLEKSDDLCLGRLSSRIIIQFSLTNMHKGSLKQHIYIFINVTGSKPLSWLYNNEYTAPCGILQCVSSVWRGQLQPTVCSGAALSPVKQFISTHWCVLSARICLCIVIINAYHYSLLNSYHYSLLNSYHYSLLNSYHYSLLLLQVSALNIGPFSFTLHQLFISVVTTLIVFPPNLFIVTVFRKARAKKTSIMQMNQNIPKKSRKFRWRTFNPGSSLWSNVERTKMQKVRSISKHHLL